jgi:hypothetical protein
METKEKTHAEKMSFFAVITEALIVAGCTLLIVNHYYESSRGITVVSAVGVLLVAVVAIAGLHFFLKGVTPTFKYIAFSCWLVLTLLEAGLAATVWIGMQHARGGSDAKVAITAKQEQLKTTKDRDVRKQIQVDIADLRRESNKPLFTEDQTELKWLYETGIHSLPFPFGIAGMAILLLAGITKEKAEEKPKGAELKPVQSSGSNPPSRPVGFQPQTVTAKDRSPKDQGHWI